MKRVTKEEVLRQWRKAFAERKRGLSRESWARVDECARAKEAEIRAQSEEEFQRNLLTIEQVLGNLARIVGWVVSV